MVELSQLTWTSSVTPPRSVAVRRGCADYGPWTIIPSWLSMAVKKASREAAIFAVLRTMRGVDSDPGEAAS